MHAYVLSKNFAIYSFEWRIDDTASFYVNWQAVVYPMHYYGNTSAVSQVLDIVPPASGEFSVQCSSNQDGVYSTTTNLTLRVEEGPSKWVLSTEWIIAISVSCGILLIVIIVVIFAFICGLCCFKKSKKKAQEQRRETADVPNDNVHGFKSPSIHDHAVELNQSRRPDNVHKVIMIEIA